ncbi:MAG: SEC-C metal-binding domain-containing protein, partial [Flavobacteriales bacterium]
VMGHTKENFDDFNLELIRVVETESPVSSSEYKIEDEATLINKTYDAIRENYLRKNAKIAESAMPQIKHVYETMADKYQNIVFPLTDGRKEMQLVINLKEAYNSNGSNISQAFEKNVILGMIDNEWKEHLREMDELRSAVSHAQYEQKDPLLVYKLESFNLFKVMLSRMNTETMELLMKLNIPVTKEAIQTTNKEVTSQSNYNQAKTTSSSDTPIPTREGYDQAIASSGNQQQAVKQKPVIAEKKVGRNEPCPCGSGKKYKQCHGK